MGPDPLDLMHQGADRVIASYLLETDDGLALFDCGPTTCLLRLKAALVERGVELGDVRHLLLSHIHLDHAGAAGVLVREHPELLVHVSEIGAPHLADPSRLETSARRLYGDTFDTLWGELAPVPQENIRIVAARVLGLDCFPTQGHASHHVSYLDAAGTLYAGDAAGVRILPERTVLPPTPPPEFDLDVWLEAIDEIERRQPERLGLIHFGVIPEPTAHLDELRRRLVEWVRLVQTGVTQEQFSESVRSEVTATADDVELYERAMPFWQSYAGLERYTRTHAG